jgi:hypothetical protein
MKVKSRGDLGEDVDAQMGGENVYRHLPSERIWAWMQIV